MVPNDSPEPQKYGSETAPRKIRSMHRRRLLNRLTEGGATVSALARDVGLRVPHASAELRRMRNDGLVASDLPAGSRGARIHLAESGWESVRGDEWIRATEAAPLPDDTSMCCLLARDGPNLLLGVMEPTDSPLLLIPDRPPTPIVDDPASTGSDGVPWSWAVLKERNPRWFDLSSMELKPAPPPPSDPGSIATYSGERTVIGIIRARLLDSERPIAIAPGQWFGTPIFRPTPPLLESSYHRGQWVLGACHDLSPNVRPKNPIAAVMEERLPRSMLLRTARANSLVIADLGGLDAEGDAFPLSALDYWIERAHPRLSDAERRKRVQALRDRVSSTRRVRTDDSTWRRFRRDWGESEFTEDEGAIRILDLRGLGDSSVEALVRWALSDEERPPMVLEVSEDMPDDLLSSIVSHSNLRLALLERAAPAFATFDTLEADPLRPLPWLRLSTRGGKVMPVRLMDPMQTPVSISLDEPATSPWASLGIELDEPEELDEGYLSVINSAVSQHPKGDEEWANQMEARYPIAAWIASPPQTRWPRWQRLRGRLESEWLVLMDLDNLPLERLSEIAEEAPDSVLAEFSIKMTAKLREDQETALRTRPASDPKDASRGAAWVAAQLLSNAPWLPEHMHSDLMNWSLEAWLSNPPLDSIKALEGVAWLYSSDRGDDISFRPIIEGIRSKAQEMPVDHDLKTWARLVGRVLGENELDLEELERTANILPTGWWATISSESLISLLSEEESTDWLISNPLPWCAAVLRPIGEECQAPGLRSHTHPGCAPEIHSLLIRRLRGRREREGLPDSAAPLIDLMEALDAINEGRPPSPGRTHPLSGWLAQPVGKWPEFSASVALDGNAEIAERLLLRSSGYHGEIVSSTSISG